MIFLYSSLYLLVPVKDFIIKQIFLWKDKKENKRFMIERTFSNYIFDRNGRRNKIDSANYCVWVLFKLV